MKKDAKNNRTMKVDRLCFLSRNYRESRSAGSKAKQDYEDILASMGAVNLGLKRSHHRGKVLTFILNLVGVARCCMSMRRGDMLVLQYPVKKYFTFLCHRARKRGATTVALIHDLGSFRRKKLTVQQELDRLGLVDNVIATNATMGDWLKDQGLDKPIVALGLHDYLSTALVPGLDGHRQQGPWRIAYAGTIRARKNSFIHQYAAAIEGYELHIFGTESDEHPIPESPHVVKHGFIEPDDFMTTNGCDFGLVWDGDSLDCCSGPFGEYLKYNTPHKLSLYLRAGLPVIMWSQSAVAPLVTSLGIGLTIDSLKEVSSKLDSLDDEQISVLHHNVAKVADDIANGRFLKTALQQLM